VNTALKTISHNATHVVNESSRTRVDRLKLGAVDVSTRAVVDASLATPPAAVVSRGRRLPQTQTGAAVARHDVTPVYGHCKFYTNKTLKKCVAK